MNLFHLSKTKPQDKTKGGMRTKVSKQNFPILKGMALYKLVLHKDGVREPHWHPNADELGYCLSGKALVTIYGNYDLTETFLVSEGEVFLVPSGFLHHIENVGDGECSFIIQFSHEEPEDFGISSALGFFSDAVLGNTWAVNKDVFKRLKRSTEPTFASIRKSPPKIPEKAKYKTPYRYALEESQPLLSVEGGKAKMARQNVWPTLKHQSLYSLYLSGKGMREPHWHPDTAEFGYVEKGKARMSILNADCTVVTYELNEGDVYFIPKAYPHHIENLRDDEMHFLVFFDIPQPGDIGFTAGVRAYSNEVLGATMNIEPSFFEQLPKYYKDLFIVDKVNPLD